jgi:hypothetical protein
LTNLNFVFLVSNYTNYTNDTLGGAPDQPGFPTVFAILMVIIGGAVLAGAATVAFMACIMPPYDPVHEGADPSGIPI